MGKKDARREARECFMQLLFEMEMHQDYSNDKKGQFLSRLELLRDYNREGNKPSTEAEAKLTDTKTKYPEYIAISPEQKVESVKEKAKSTELEYFDRMFDIVTEHLDEIDQVLADSSANWKIDRIARVDLAVLRLSAAEIIYYKEIPDSVSINEAVDLAKKFGSQDSGKFINGILGKVARGKDGDDGEKA